MNFLVYFTEKYCTRVGTLGSKKDGGVRSQAPKQWEFSCAFLLPASGDLGPAGRSLRRLPRPCPASPSSGRETSPPTAVDRPPPGEYLPICRLGVDPIPRRRSSLMPPDKVRGTIFLLEASISISISASMFLHLDLRYRHLIRPLLPALVCLPRSRRESEGRRGSRRSRRRGTAVERRGGRRKLPRRCSDHEAVVLGALVGVGERGVGGVDLHELVCRRALPIRRHYVRVARPR